MTPRTRARGASEVPADWPPLPFSRPSDFQRLRENGRLDGIPECCIGEFIQDVAGGRLPAGLRETVPDGNGGAYVPCSRCVEAIS